MDMDQTFKHCLLLWDAKYKGKGTGFDFQEIVLQNDHNGLWRKVFLTRFYCLCSKNGNWLPGMPIPDDPCG